jgi:hypothetical protein
MLPTQEEAAMVEAEDLQRATFIVRVDRDAAGGVTGVVERVRTGEKTRVQAISDVGRILAAMLGGEDPRRPPRS